MSQNASGQNAQPVARTVAAADHGKLDIQALVLLAVLLAAAMLPVVLLTAVFNAVLVQALYLPIRKALKLAD